MFYVSLILFIFSFFSFLIGCLVCLTRWMDRHIRITLRCEGSDRAHDKLSVSRKMRSNP